MWTLCKPLLEVFVPLHVVEHRTHLRQGVISLQAVENAPLAKRRKIRNLSQASQGIIDNVINVLSLMPMCSIVSAVR